MENIIKETTNNYINDLENKILILFSQYKELNRFYNKIEYDMKDHIYKWMYSNIG